MATPCVRFAPVAGSVLAEARNARMSILTEKPLRAPRTPFEWIAAHTNDPTIRALLEVFATKL